ncbi:DUF4129 domain-containing protein [Actinoplanes sp. N902-109]|uniref:DUF4129 domain-containing protein n=1 Tax=Actinoplanes sp. (strain N902-109) TaxID=649831 RepID=UPI00032965A6|nr:DUF4129 domain-containing protein [Actinoplanes sp. N902-109]AGL15243.1 hypothetical protein L083_1733 [Actinoplanes sp. N902-109]
MTRAWDEFAAAVFDRVPPPLLFLLLLLAAGLVGVLWYYWPRWVPRRLPRWRLPRFEQRPKRPKQVKPPPEKKPAEPEPEFEPTVVLPGGMLLADQLAAQGRYAEAIRQRLRDVVGDLTAAGVVAPLPGTTAAEVASSAAVQRPAVAAPLGGATELFSEVWYGNRPAQRSHDDHMRALTGEVRSRMGGPRA